MLALAYGAYEIYGMLTKPDLTPEKGPEQPEQTGLPSKPAPKLMEPSETEEPARQETWGRDPFVDVSTSRIVALQRTTETTEEGPEPEELELKAISRMGEEACALINRYVCGVGDVVEGHRVVEITDYQVVLDEGKRRMVLTLPGR